MQREWVNSTYWFRIRFLEDVWKLFVLNSPSPFFFQINCINRSPHNMFGTCSSSGVSCFAGFQWTCFLFCVNSSDHALVSLPRTQLWEREWDWSNVCGGSFFRFCLKKVAKTKWAFYACWMCSTNSKESPLAGISQNFEMKFFLNNFGIAPKPTLLLGILLYVEAWRIVSVPPFWARICLNGFSLSLILALQFIPWYVGRTTTTTYNVAKKPMCLLKNNKTHTHQKCSAMTTINTYLGIFWSALNVSQIWILAVSLLCNAQWLIPGLLAS